jgi:hypothetical protein
MRQPQPQLAGGAPPPPRDRPGLSANAESFAPKAAAPSASRMDAGQWPLAAVATDRALATQGAGWHKLQGG